MNALPTSSVIPVAAPTNALAIPLFAAFVLGLVMVWGVEFSDVPAAHNAAHDVRHANGRPCH